LRKAVFLDRDGLINRRAAPHDYIKAPEAFQLLPGVPEAIRALNQAGYLILVVTNQRGVARGMMTMDDVNNIHQYMREELSKHGAHIDGIYVCPHDYGQCRCRKPDIGLFLQTEADFEIIKSASWMIGDSGNDVEAGRRYGVKTILTTDLHQAVQTVLENEVSGMKVLITGGAGYIGSHTNKLLHDRGIETVVVDDLSGGHVEAVVCGRFVQGDFGNKALMDQLIKAERFDAVLHFAAFASVSDSVARPARYYHNNVTNMQTLLDCCVEHGVKYFVFSSSASTFGEPLYTPMDEDHPQQPINPYGTTKLIGEKLLADYERAYGLRYCAFRYFCAAGDSKDGRIGEAHDPETHLIPVMIKAAINNQPFSVFGTDYDTRDGSCVRDFIHVLDLAQAHYLGLKYIMENNRSDCFNLGSNAGFTVLEMIQALERVAGKPVPYQLAGRRAGDPASLIASNKKAKELLGWEPIHSGIGEILTDAWNWESRRSY